MSILNFEVFKQYAERTKNFIVTEFVSAFSSLRNEIDVERKRINTFTSLPNGSTSGDAELADIRVGYNRVTYETAGESVRGQVSDLYNEIGVAKEDLSKLSKRVITPTQLDRAYQNGNYIVEKGIVFKNESVCEVSQNCFYSKSENFIVIPDGTYTSGNMTAVVSDGVISVTGKNISAYTQINIPLGYDIPTSKVYNGETLCEYWISYNVGGNDLPFVIRIRTSEDRNLASEGQYSAPKRFTITKDTENNTYVSLKEMQIITTSVISFDTPIEARVMLKPIMDDTITDFVKGTGVYRNTTKLVLDENTYIITELGDELTVKKYEKKADKINVIATGDGLTGSSQYPNILQTLLGNKFNVINNGIGGETSATICARNGALNMVVSNTSIPSNTTRVKLCNAGAGIPTNDPRYVARPLKQKAVANSDGVEYDGGVNPCFINGVEGTLTIEQPNGVDDNTQDVYYFTRKRAGNTVSITRPTAIVTNNMNNTDIFNGINIMWFGTDGGWYPSNADGLEVSELCKGLVNQYKAMIDIHNMDKYIILGLWHTDWTEDERIEAERIMFDTFGRHFLNIREYLIDYGLYDSNLTRTEEDSTRISEGKIPLSLMDDNEQLNSYGQQIVAEQVYKRGIELRYW